MYKNEVGQLRHAIDSITRRNARELKEAQDNIDSHKKRLSKFGVSEREMATQIRALEDELQKLRADNVKSRETISRMEQQLRETQVKNTTFILLLNINDK